MGQYQVDDGAHILTKIIKMQEYLEQISEPGGDDDLVLLADGYDTWFQLRPDVLITRYHAMNHAANARLKQRLGKRTVKDLEINQRVIFGASKVCSNQPHTLACFPIPEPYTPKDLYGGNTDTVIGRNKHYSFRPRYLASGYLIGPVRDLRDILARARHKIDNLPDFDRDLDNGSGTSDFLYHGDDTSVFARILGEQEYMRETLRRRYSGAGSLKGKLLGQSADKVGGGSMEGQSISDVLNPPFTHERMPDDIPDERLYEFGIGLDYGGDIGMQTHNAERDYGYIVYTANHTDTLGERPKRLDRQHEEHPPDEDDPMTLAQQIEHQWPERNDFDCKVRVRDNIPPDVARSELPYAAAPQVIITPDGGQSPQDAPSNTSWSEIRLYTNLCLGSVPVMIHHNGDRNLREQDWAKIWWQRYGSTLLEEAKMARREPKAWMRGMIGEEGQQEQPKGAGVGAWSDKGWFVQWEQLCPRDFEWELFRGLD